MPERVTKAPTNEPTCVAVHVMNVHQLRGLSSKLQYEMQFILVIENNHVIAKISAPFFCSRPCFQGILVL